MGAMARNGLEDASRPLETGSFESGILLLCAMQNMECVLRLPTRGWRQSKLVPVG
jgi:hypothetical protein